MPYGFYISAEGAHAQSRRLEVIANNMANIDTVGFKKELAIIQARHAEAISRGMDTWGSGTINNIGGGVLPSDSRTSFGAGPLQATGKDSDLAIDGDGFFVVQSSEGTRHLTRAGNFQITREGRLVAQYGPSRYSVLNGQLQPIQLNPDDPRFRVTSDGAIEQDGIRHELAMVRPTHELDMRHDGENVFTALSGFTPIEPGERRVASGFLEKSNVNPVTEMVQMIETSRVLETNIRMMQMQDEAVGGLLSRLLRA